MVGCNKLDSVVLDALMQPSYKPRSLISGTLAEAMSGLQGDLA
jgi:hypothetical protein